MGSGRITRFGIGAFGDVDCNLPGHEPRLLLLTDKFAPHAGGTAVVYRNWCDRLPPSAIRVCTRWFPGCREFDATRPYAIHRAPYLDIPKLRMPLVWSRIWCEGLRQCARTRPDVVHAGQICGPGVCALWMRRRWGIPYLVHTYGEELNYYARSEFTHGLMRRVLRSASAVTVNSRYTAGRLVQLGLWGGPVSLLYGGVDTARFTGAGGEGIRARYGLGDAPLLVTVARLTRRKGQDQVIEALPEIRRRIPKVRYLIVGKGLEEPRLRELVRQHGLGDTVIFSGAVPDEALPAYFAAADVFIHPNRQLQSGDVEGFGLVFLEASASGIPVIGGNTGGTPDAIQDGVTGFLVDPTSREELVDRATALLRQPELRSRMGEAGRRWAARFTWEAAAGTVWELSQGVAAAPSSPVPAARVCRA